MIHLMTAAPAKLAKQAGHAPAAENVFGARTYMKPVWHYDSNIRAVHVRLVLQHNLTFVIIALGSCTARWAGSGLCALAGASMIKAAAPCRVALPSSCLGL